MDVFHQAASGRRKEILKVIKDLLYAEPSIIFSFVFGSFLDGIAFRDIDVGIFVTPVRPRFLIDFELELSSRVEEALPRYFRVDIKVINSAPLPFRFNVIRGKLLFSRDDRLLDEFIVSTVRQYIDFAPVRTRYLKEALLS